MHDPQILAFDIKYPWWQSKPWPKKFQHSGSDRFAWKRMSEKEQRGCEPHWPQGYRDTFVNIWHVDPEKDGTDDSCGWSWPKLTKKQRKILHNTAWSEGRDPHFLC